MGELLDLTAYELAEEVEAREVSAREAAEVANRRVEEVEPKAAWISPVPGGVGPMTRAMLLYNAVQAARMSSGGWWR